MSKKIKVEMAGTAVKRATRKNSVTEHQHSVNAINQHLSPPSAQLLYFILK